jgi:LPS-assembly protein
VAARLNRQTGRRLRVRGLYLTVAMGLLGLLAASSAHSYEEKELIKPITKRPAKGTKVDVESSRITYNETTGQAEATGRVVIEYGPYTLNATKVRYNRKTGAFSANGSIEMREPNGNVLRASEINLRNKMRDGFARHLTAVLTNNVTVRARYAKRTEGRYTVYEDARYTACRDCNTRNGEPLWEVVTERTLHDEKAQTLYHTKPRLKIGGITVAGLPYLEQPDPRVKRRSGWLIPKGSTGKAYGVGVTTPYFWAPAPNWDITFSPMWTIYQGPVADAELRYATQQGVISLRGSGVYQFKDRKPPNDYKWRGAVTAKGDFKANEDWTYGFEGTLASDRDFLNAYDLDGRNLAENRVYATGLWDRTYISAQALNFSPLDTDLTSNYLPTALPFLTGDHTVQNETLGEVSLAWSAYSLTRDQSYSPYSTVYHAEKQARAVADLSWRKQMINSAGQVITPFARLRSDVTRVSDLLDPAVGGGLRNGDVTSRFLPSAGIDMRWPMISGTDYGQSIISPVAQLITATDETDIDKIGNEDAVSLNFDHTSLFLEDRFTGFDRYEGGTRANLGFTYSFLANNGGFVRASAGESFHIAGRNSFVSTSGLEGAKSDLVGAITVQPWEALSLSYEVRVEEDFSDVNRQEARASLTFDSFSGQISYINLDAEPSYGRLNKLHEIAAETRLRISDGWFLLNGLKYDFAKSGLREAKAGVEFDCDCMNFKAAYTFSNPKNESADHRVMFSIDLATLGGTKASVGF